MVLILFMLTIAFFFTIEALRKSLAASRQAPAPAISPGFEVYKIKNPVTYYHPGHCWVALETPALSRVGVDDISRLVIGKPDAITLPNIGDFIRQGDPIVRLHRHGKSLTQVSPISGVVEETIGLPFDGLGTTLGDESAQGWIAKLRPIDFARDTVNLLSGSSAHRWLEATRLELLRHFAPQLGLLAQDGGTIYKPLSEVLGDNEWDKLVRQMYPSIPLPTSSQIYS